MGLPVSTGNSRPRGPWLAPRTLELMARVSVSLDPKLGRNLSPGCWPLTPLPVLLHSWGDSAPAPIPARGSCEGGGAGRAPECCEGRRSPEVGGKTCVSLSLPSGQAGGPERGGSGHTAQGSWPGPGGLGTKACLGRRERVVGWGWECGMDSVAGGRRGEEDRSSSTKGTSRAGQVGCCTRQVGCKALEA